ncbi:MAG: TatD family hydrolase [Candidatus Paceibacterota bacterium]|jgi:TatD DNase family protein
MKSKYIDIHCHTNFKVFDEDRDTVIKRALDNNTWHINVGTQIDTSKEAVRIAEKYDEGVYAIVGLHPIHTEESFHDEKELGAEGGSFTSRGEVFDKKAYLELLKNKKVVGVGECGLDYFRISPESVENQKDIFIKHIELANEINKPLMLHLRNNPKDKSHNAYKDALLLLKKYAKVRGNAHFFAGTEEEAEEFLDFGFTLSFTGVITFTHDYDEVIKLTPIDKIMSETDSPYLAPVPYRGKRNEPFFVREVVKRISEIKGLNEEETALAIFSNAKRVFGI